MSLLFPCSLWSSDAAGLLGGMSGGFGVVMSVVRRCAGGLAAGLLGTSAALATGLPAEKGAVEAYARACGALGAGFVHVPGTDSCFRIAGHVRTDFGYGEPEGRTIVEADGNGRATAARRDGRHRDATGFHARGRFDAEARTPTDHGILRTFLRYEIDSNTGVHGASYPGALLEKAYGQWAGFTAGRAGSFFDFYANRLNWSYGFLGLFGSDRSLGLLGYTADLGGGLSAALSIEDARPRRANPHRHHVAGQHLPDVVANVTVERDWGAARLSGAMHQLRSSAFQPASIGLPGGRVDTAYGWAMQGGVRLDVPALAGGDVLWLQAAYADGAVDYLGIRDIAHADYASPVADGAVAAGAISTTRGWNVTAAFLHHWIPSVRQSLFGGYTGVAYGRAVKAEHADLRDFGAWAVGSNVTWSPAGAFEIGVEVLYSRVARAAFGGEIPPPRRFRSEDAVSGRLRLQHDF